MCRKLIYTISFVLLSGLIMPALGQQLTLENADFDATAMADGAWGGIPAGWLGVGANEQDLTTSSLNPPAQSGENICAFNQDTSIYQGLMLGGDEVVVEANKIYKITVWVGRRAGNEGSFGGILQVFLQDVRTSTIIDEATYDMDNPDQPRNSWTFQTFYLSTGPNPPGLGSQLQVGFANISTRAPANQFWFSQVILDDVSVEALSPIAINPIPTNGSLINTTAVSLEWLPGPFATQHDIYFSDNFDDVDAATSSDPMGPDNVYKAQQSADSFTIDGLVPGTTYYWRIDEVGGGATYKGDIWTVIVRPTTPYDPIPINDAPFVDVIVELSWSPGTSAISHVVYFGDNRENVQAGTADTNKGTVDGSTFTPETLEYEKAYYWRIDANDGTNIHTGEVWTFRTAPEIPINDSNLVAWWMLDDASGIGAFDSSGYGNHGTLFGGLTWAPGKINGALKSDGVDGSFVDCGNPDSLNITDAITLTAWVNTNDAGNSENNPYITKGNDSYALRHDVGNNIGFFIYDAQLYSASSSVSNSFNGVWHHLAGIYDGSELNLYIDGESMATTEYSGSIAISTFNVSIGSDTQQTWMWYDGSIDDVRIYNRALAADEIVQIIAGNTALASEPNPEYASIIQMPDAVSLSWSPGDNAAEHDVYLGTEKKSVADADTSTTEIYRGTQGATSYTPPEGFEWGQTYFWRIDEINNDGTISTGSVWTFTVADYIVIEDFEDYNDYPPDEIWNTWIDGYDIPTNGSTAGYPDPDFVMGEHYLEDETVHSGDWSFPLFYDNSVGLSEVSRSLDADFTVYGVNTLTLWYHGVTGNAAETMYVALNDTAVVVNDDANAALVNMWVRWDIPLQLFADKGVNLANVSMISIGFGNKANPVAGGEGHVSFDDIRLYRK